jgi:Camelysin metallo-endopeptidase
VGRTIKVRRRRLGTLGAALRRGLEQGTVGAPATVAGALGDGPAAGRGGSGASAADSVARGVFATARLAGDASAAGPIGGLGAAARAAGRRDAASDRDAQHDRDPRNRKRTLATLALGLLAVATAVGSGADFSARTANPSNTFSAGALSMENSKDGTAILDASNLKPGADPKTGIVDIKNMGSIDGVFKLTRDELTNTDTGNDNPAPFASKVAVGIVDCGKFTTFNGPYGPDPVTPTCGDENDTTIYLGSLANENSALDLGTYAPGEKHRYQFAGSLASSAGNEYQGDGASARYVFDATQKP